MHYKNFNIANKNYLLPIIFALSFTPLLWFQKDLLIAGGDQSFYINPGFLQRRLFLWENLINGGSFSNSINTIFPFFASYKFTELLGLSNHVFQRLWFVFLYFFAIISIRFLYNTITSKKDSVGTLIAVAFYLFNLYTLVISPLQILDWEIYAAFPLTLALFIKGLDEKSNSNKYIILGGLSTIFFSGTHPAMFFVGFVPLTLYSFYFLVRKQKKGIFFYCIFFTIKFFLFIFAVNLWSLYPTFCFLSPYTQTETNSYGAINLWATVSTHLYQAFHLQGQWCWGLNPLNKYYSNSLFISFGYIYPFFIILALFFNFKERNFLYFFLLAIVGLFLTKGINPPLGFLYKFAYINIPGFAAYREPFTKFTFVTALAYSIIIGFVVEKIWLDWVVIKNFKNALYKFVFRGAFLFFVFWVLFVNVWPMFSKDFFPSGNKQKKSLHVKVPPYWEDARDWLSSDKEHFAILELPKDSGYGTYFNWDYGYNGLNPSLFLLDVPLWGHNAITNTYADYMVDYVYNGFYGKKTENLSVLLSLMNIKYIHLRVDIDWEGSGLTSLEQNRHALNYQKGITFKQKFEQKEFYQNEYFLPLVYGASNIKILNKLPWEYEDFSFLDDLTGKSRPAFISAVQSNNAVAEKIRGYYQNDFFINYEPTIIFQKINPAKYIVDITCTRPFCLVFSQAYHPDWSAYVDGRKVSTHFVVNGYANGYLIENIGNFKVELTFTPQRYENFFIYIALVFILSALFFFLKKNIVFPLRRTTFKK